MSRLMTDRWVCSCGEPNPQIVRTCGLCGAYRPAEDWGGPASAASGAERAAPAWRPPRWLLALPVVLVLLGVLIPIASLRQPAPVVPYVDTPPPGAFGGAGGPAGGAPAGVDLPPPPVAVYSAPASPLPAVPAAVLPGPPGGGRQWPAPPMPAGDPPRRSALPAAYADPLARGGDTRPEPVPGSVVMPNAAPGPPAGAADGSRGAMPALEPPYSASVVERVQPSVVMIVARARSGVRRGAAFVVGPRELITSARLVWDARRLDARTAAGDPLPVALGPVDHRSDLALLRSDGPLPPPVRLGDNAPAGERVAITGYPLTDGRAGSYSPPAGYTVAGTVHSRVVRESPWGELLSLIRVDADVTPGHAGGPVYSLRDGAVLGMLSFRVVNDEITGFAITPHAVRRLLAR